MIEHPARVLALYNLRNGLQDADVAESQALKVDVSEIGVAEVVQAMATTVLATAVPAPSALSDDAS